MRDVIALLMTTLTLCLGCDPVLAQTHPGGVPPLATIRMIDALTGWAVTDESGVETVGHTSDGGTHWLDVSPLKTSGGQTVVYQVTALSSRVAWVAPSDAIAGAPPGTVQICRTVDGGRTWRSTALPAESTISIDFVNARDGWVLLNEGGAAGSMEVDIYHSTDGGGTWTRVESTKVNDESSGLPFAGDKTGLTFLDTTRGWATGNIASDDWMYLYVTNDGGRRWQQERLRLPPRATPHWNDWTMSPMFFTGRDGILPVFYAIMNEAHRDIAAVVVFYVTHDGGTTWTYTTPVSVTLGKEFPTSFADIDHGWVTDGTTLYATSDGGRRWTTIRPAPFLADVTQLDFISPRVGWAVRRTSPFLVKTLDGGHTWAPVAYTISRP
jgi:photosystem II stability/assembly factor-like uncharacterized protein